jgi:hypothetical protein
VNTDDRLYLVPFQEAPYPPMTRELHDACVHSMHVLTADGELLRAGRATLFVLERTTPGWRTFARVFRYVPLLWFVELGYWIVARNRRLFSRVLNLRAR